MTDEADAAQMLEGAERAGALARQQAGWVPGLAAEATPLPGHNPHLRAELLAENERLCGTCGDPIPAARLAARPDATMCVECQQEHERGT